MSTTTGRAKVTRGHSCFVCYQRKVKCDGRRPCSTCVKTGRSSECRDTRPREAPPPTSNIELLLRLRRYEALLTAHDIPLDGQVPGDRETSGACEPTPPAAESDNGHIIMQRGHPRFVESAIWNRLGSELAEDVPRVNEDDESDVVGEASVIPDELVLGRPSCDSLASLHPPVPQILQLWQIFLAHFYPLVMIFHAPSVQHTISKAVTNLDDINPSTEALLFSIYLCSVTTMTSRECLVQLGEPKATLLGRFSSATQQALVDAQFLRSTDLTILQALTLYLLASRRYVNAQSLWLLTGLASRLAQTMGLHREHALKHLSPYDAEIRRRLWWQVITLDNRLAQLSGSTTTDGDFRESFDTKRPLNLPDSDLSPHISELPKEHDGPTDMLFCTIRLEVGDCMRQLKVIDKDCRAKHALCKRQKEQIVNEFENKIERILGRCDSSIPIHLLTIFLGRSAVCQKRLLIRQPTQQIHNGAVLSQDDKDVLFRLALQVMIYDHLTYSTKSLQPFLWHVGNYFPFQAFIVLLMDLLHRVQGEEADRAWAIVNQAYEDHPELINNVKNPLHFALGNLTLKAWERRVSSADPKSHAYQLTTSPIITKLQSQRPAKTGNSGPPLNGEGARYSIQMTSTSQFDLIQSACDMAVTDLPQILTDATDNGWAYWPDSS